ncbi:MAG TPA: hypothetical protein VGL33_22745, partial [Streptosporangiaceae bacterium]
MPPFCRPARLAGRATRRSGPDPGLTSKVAGRAGQVQPRGAARGPGRNTMQLARRPRPQTTRHGGRMGPFHLESIAAGGDRAVLR